MKQCLLFRYRLSSYATVALLVLAASQRVTAAEPKPDLVFLLAGQSNMVGHGRGEQLAPDDATVPGNVLLYQANTLRALAPKRTKEANPNGGSFGPELAFGRELGRAMPDRTIILVKHAIGGTSLSDDWNPERRGRLYDKLLTEYRAAIRDRKIELGAVLWSQGGADAKEEASARAYAANLRTLIESFRRDLAAPELPFYIGGARPEDPSSATVRSRFPHLDLVRAAFVEAEKTVPHTRIISTVDLSMARDGIHYDTAGQLEFGQRFARAYLDDHGRAGYRR
jgi:hypothetical protein